MTEVKRMAMVGMGGHHKKGDRITGTWPDMLRMWSMLLFIAELTKKTFIKKSFAHINF